MKKLKSSHTSSSQGSSSSGDWHVNKSSMGMGDYYGTGIKAKLGRVIEGAGMKAISSRKLGIPPKNVV